MLVTIKLRNIKTNIRDRGEQKIHLPLLEVVLHFNEVIKGLLYYVCYIKDYTLYKYLLV